MSTAADGHIYALPKYQRYWPKNQIRMMINKVWLDNLGLEIPETWDELYDVLVAFKTRDPNGNGVADEIPMDWAPGTGGFNVTVLLAGYGIAAPYPYGNGLYVENGKVGNFFADPRYKELVQFLNKCFSGLVNPGGLHAGLHQVPGSRQRNGASSAGRLHVRLGASGQAGLEWAPRPSPFLAQTEQGLHWTHVLGLQLLRSELRPELHNNDHEVSAQRSSDEVHRSVL